jgi:hypothetical protein
MVIQLFGKDRSSSKVSADDQAVAKDLVEYLRIAWQYAEGDDQKTVVIESWMDLVAKLADLGDGYVAATLVLRDAQEKEDRKGQPDDEVDTEGAS